MHVGLGGLHIINTIHTLAQCAFSKAVVFAKNVMSTELSLLDISAGKLPKIVETCLPPFAGIVKLQGQLLADV